MSFDERIKPDLRAVPDTCGIWHVQARTDRGLAWLADEASGQPDQTVVVLDEYVAELADKARDAGLILILLDGTPPGSSIEAGPPDRMMPFGFIAANAASAF